MAIANGLIRALRQYGAASEANKAQLETWRDKALESIAAGNGAHTVSGSANGASFSQQANMTNAEWFTALQEALRLIEAGITSTSRSYGRIC